MINFSNGVANLRNSPGLAADTVAKQPAAANVAIGTIYIQTDGGKIQRSNGTSWIDIGGGGTTPGIDDVLAVGQLLTTNRDINTNNFVFSINSGSDKMLQLNYDYQVIGDITTTGLKLKQDVDKIATFYNNTEKGLIIDFNNLIYQIGDENYFIDIDSNNLYIRTFTDATKYGAELTKDTVKIGDYDNNYNKVQIFIDDPNQTIVHDTNGGENQFNGNVISFNGGVLSGTASGSSGQHLEIYINGNPYKIALLNP